MAISSYSAYPYQVGGSLRTDSLSYVARQADQQLYKALHEGKLCYIFNARQVGKSSLRVQIKSCLEAEGFRCAAIDMTSIGSETVTPQQWYKGLTSELWRALGLGAILPFKPWWQEQADNTPIQILSNFLEDVLFAHISTKIVIFLDEIDCILNLPFAVDDFFAWVRFCSDYRSENPCYQRLTFVLLGVATPSDLIRSHTRTPFNIGEAIDLSGFSLQEALPLAQGLQHGDYAPEALLQAILDWTNGQPFLTQKLCQLLVDQVAANQTMVESKDFTAAQVIRKLVFDQILSDWKRFDQPEHLRTIRDRLLADSSKSGRLLGLYRCILQGELIRSNDSQEQLDLLLTGLVIRQYGVLQIKCRLYQEVFNLAWVQRHLDALRPYAQAIQAWEIDPTDESRLLRGKTLAKAQAWAEGQRLNDDDYRFLAASEALDRRMMEDTLRLSRTEEISRRLEQEQKSNRKQRRLIIALSTFLLISLGLGTLTFFSYQRAAKSEEEAALAAIQARITSSESLIVASRRLDALVAALRAKQELAALPFAPPTLVTSADSALRKAVFRSVERNRFVSQGELRGVDISPDGQRMASTDADGLINIWQPNGQRLFSFRDPTPGNGCFGLKFSPDSQQLATTGEDGQIRLWNVQGKLLLTIPAHKGAALAVVFSPDGQWIISAGADKVIKIWNRQGKLLQILPGHQDEIWGLAISPDGQVIASGSRDRTVKLWSRNGPLLHTLTGYDGPVRGLAFSPNSQTLITSSDDTTVRIWRRNGQLLRAYRAHDDAVQAVAYAPNGQYFVTASWDKTLRIWNPDGSLLRQLQGHQDRVWAVAVTPNSDTILSGSWDLTIRSWQLRDTLTTPLIGHTAAVLSVAYSPDGKTIASASDDRTVRLWSPDGTSRDVLNGHQAETYSAVFSPQNQSIISSGLDRTLKLWNRQGKLLKTFTGHNAEIWSVAFSPNSQLIASASFDYTARLWNPEGKQLRLFRVPAARIHRVDFSPDGKLIATASSDAIVRIWSINGTLQATLKGHRGIVQSVSFSPDGKILATAGADNTVKLWQLDGILIRSIPAHTQYVSDVQFSPNGQLLASASFDGSIKLWQLDGTLVSTLEGHQSRVWRIAWNPNGQELASAGEDKLVLVWDLAKVQSNNHVEQFACRWLKDYLQTNPSLTEPERRLCRN